MIKNIDLHNSVQKTVISAFEFYKANLIFDQVYNDPVYLTISLKKNESQIEQLPDFIQSVKLMSEDRAISSLEYKLVGSWSSAATIGSLSNCLHAFLQQLFIDIPGYSREIVEIKYEKFEDFFYSSELVKRDITRLHNFYYSGTEVHLGTGLSIKKTIDSESNHQNNQVPRSFYSSISKSDFILEREYKTKKINHSLTSGQELLEIEKKEMPPSSEVFDTVVTSLRLLKSSAIYRDPKIQTKLISFSPTPVTVTTSPAFESIVTGEKCHLQDSEISELLRLFEYVSSEVDSRFGIASRRLTTGMERRTKEDRLIDYMVGLETLYLPDGSSELSFRLSLRVSFLLFQDQGDRRMTFKFLRNIYEIRSLILHGKTYNLPAEDVLKTEDLLRQSIKLWIKDKDNFLAKKANDDGKLNTIFFE